MMRDSAGGTLDETSVMLFESALAEIGANTLTHGRPETVDAPVEYALDLEGRTATATFTDRGPPVHNHLTRSMPEPASETVPPRLTVVGDTDAMPTRGYIGTVCGTLECNPRPVYEANPV